MTDAQLITSSQNNAIADNIREQISYDKNSNVIRLSDTKGLSTTTRNYVVQGNQVIQMIVNGNNLGYPTYDERGNMTQNVEAGLQMSYNLCNLPKQISTMNGKTVKYTYFADGTKFKAVDAAGSGFVYTGSLRWRVQNGVLTPESIAITGGRAVYSSNSWATNYYITDHLGSVRAVTDAEGEVLDTFDYMPYGSEISSTSSTTTDYRFTGKERQSMVNNSIYDSFARFQNTYGRFMSIDPKAESFYHISPYTYCAGDPVNLVDPNGEFPDFIWDVANVIIGAKSFSKNISEGNYKDAWVDLGGMAVDVIGAIVPGVPAGASTLIQATRSGVKVVAKYSDEAVELALNGAKNGKLRKALGLKPGSGDAHHIIPVQLLKEEEVVKSAVTGGFDFNGAINGIEVMQHHGSHPKYTEAIRTRIKNWMDDNKNYTPEDAKDFIEELTTKFRNEIFEYKKLK